MTPGFEIHRDLELRLAEVRLSAGRGNVLDLALCERLGQAFTELGADTAINAVLLSASGNDFSFGASVPEHRKGAVDTMLPKLHAMGRAIVDAALPICALVQGRCLGGGLELALLAHQIIATEHATLGLPEVTLGVYPPLGSALLPFRVRQPVVDRMVTRGDVLDADEALAVGLVDELTTLASLADRGRRWAAPYATMSGSAVRHATRAARRSFRGALDGPLGELEQSYLGSLMSTHDAVEGIEAFLQKRPPAWQHR